jgi:hypothetical protein
MESLENFYTQDNSTTSIPMLKIVIPKKIIDSNITKHTKQKKAPNFPTKTLNPMA